MKTASQPFWRRSRERDADGAGFWGPHLILDSNYHAAALIRKIGDWKIHRLFQEKLATDNISSFLKREIGDVQYIGYFKGKISFSMGISVYLQIYRALIKRNRLIFGYRRKGCINRRICKFIGISQNIGSQMKISAISNISAFE